MLQYPSTRGIIVEILDIYGKGIGDIDEKGRSSHSVYHLNILCDRM